jgi:hypothetical protein
LAKWSIAVASSTAHTAYDPDHSATGRKVGQMVRPTPETRSTAANIGQMIVLSSPHLWSSLRQVLMGAWERLL